MRRAVEASGEACGARPSQSGKEASCALAHTWKRRWIHSEDFYKNRTKTRAQCLGRAKAALASTRGQGNPRGAPGEALSRGASVGLGLARAGLYQTPADSCVGWKGPPARGPCQAWRGQAEAGRRHPKKGTFAKSGSLAATVLACTTSKSSALPAQSGASDRCRMPASLSSFSIPAPRGRAGAAPPK